MGRGNANDLLLGRSSTRSSRASLLDSAQLERVQEIVAQIEADGKAWDTLERYRDQLKPTAQSGLGLLLERVASEHIPEAPNPLEEDIPLLARATQEEVIRVLRSPGKEEISGAMIALRVAQESEDVAIQRLVDQITARDMEEHPTLASAWVDPEGPEWVRASLSMSVRRHMKKAILDTAERVGIATPYSQVVVSVSHSDGGKLHLAKSPFKVNLNRQIPHAPFLACTGEKPRVVNSVRKGVWQREISSQSDRVCELCSSREVERWREDLNDYHFVSNITQKHQLQLRVNRAAIRCAEEVEEKGAFTRVSARKCLMRDYQNSTTNPILTVFDHLDPLCLRKWAQKVAPGVKLTPKRKQDLLREMILSCQEDFEDESEHLVRRWKYEDALR